MLLSRALGVRYPGVQTLCRWVRNAASSAGLLLAISAAVLALYAGVDTAKAAALGCGILVVEQMASWLLFLRWLPGRDAAVSIDERLALRSLAEMVQFTTKLCAAQQGVGAAAQRCDIAHSPCPDLHAGAETSRAHTR